MEPGFTSKAAPLHFITPAEFGRFLVRGEDLNRRTIWVRLLPSRARFSPGYLCRSCGIYVVDFGKALFRSAVDEAAHSIAVTPEVGDRVGSEAATGVLGH